MPVPCRRRQAYDVPSTVSRGAYSPISLSVSLSALPPSLRSSADHSSPSMSADGEPLSKSYATQHRSSACARVDYFSKSSGFRIFKWRLNETGSLAASFSLSLYPASRPPCERLSASVLTELDPDGAARHGDVPTPRVCQDPSIYLSFFFFVYVEYIYPVLVLAAETFAIFLPPILRLREGRFLGRRSNAVPASSLIPSANPFERRIPMLLREP